MRIILGLNDFYIHQMRELKLKGWKHKDMGSRKT